jgi:gas vesicle protein
MADREGFSGFGVFLAFLGGAAAGAAVALLMAPTSGEETRDKLLGYANEGKDKVTRVPQALKSAYAQATEVARDAFSEAYKTVERTTGPNGSGGSNS